jgi:hypothetical protein
VHLLEQKNIGIMIATSFGEKHGKMATVFYKVINQREVAEHLLRYKITINRACRQNSKNGFSFFLLLRESISYRLQLRGG